MSGDPERHQFFEWVYTITQVAGDRYKSGDRSGLVDAISRLDNLLDSYSTDPYLSTIETASAQCMLLLAESYVDRLEFETCIEMCGGVHDILVEKAQRYIASGIQPRPDSLSWCNLIRVLAEAKWKGPLEYRDMLLAMEEMVEKYYEIDKRSRNHLRKYPNADPIRNERSLHTLLLCNLELLHLARRFAGQQLAEMRSTFEKLHKISLNDRTLPFYWECLLCQLYLDNCRDPAVVNKCIEQYLITSVNYMGDDFDPTELRRSTSILQSTMIR